MKYPKKRQGTRKVPFNTSSKENIARKRDRDPQHLFLVIVAPTPSWTWASPSMKPTVSGPFFFPITASPQQSKQKVFVFKKKQINTNCSPIPSLGGPNLQQPLETPTNLPCFLGSTFLPHPSPPLFHPTSTNSQSSVWSCPPASSGNHCGLVGSNFAWHKKPKPQPGTADVMRAASQAAFWAGLGLSYRKCVWVSRYLCDFFLRFLLEKKRKDSFLTVNGYEYYRVESENIWNKYKTKDAVNSWTMRFQGLIKHTKEISLSLWS